MAMRKEKLKIAFTVDVEDNRGPVPYLIDGDLEEFGIKENCGLDYVMDTLERFGYKGVFFVNIYESELYEPDYMPSILKKIDRRGHEIGLHDHSAENATRKKFYNRHYLLTTASEWETIYRYGLDYIETHTGKRPVSFRGGAYRINDDSFPALASCGIHVDSSVYWEHRCNDALRKYAGTRNRCFIADGVLEIPVFAVWNGKRWSRLDINSLGEDEIIAALRLINEEGEQDIVQIMMHSFSFMEQGPRREGEKELIRQGDHSTKYIYGESVRLKARFEKLLSYIKASDDYEVITFAEYYKSRPKIPAYSGDGLIYLNNRNLAFCADDIEICFNGNELCMKNNKGNPADFMQYGWRLVHTEDKNQSYWLGYREDLRSATFTFPDDANGEFKIHAYLGEHGSSYADCVHAAHYSVYVQAGKCLYYRKPLSEVKITADGKTVAGVLI